jgi:O-antigen/teichoic acid export membrane protein
LNDSRRTPITITLISIVVWLSGVWGLLQVGRLLWEKWDATPGDEASYVAIILGFIISTIVISLAGALRGGSRLARLVISAVIIVHLIGGSILLAFSREDSLFQVTAWVGIFLNLFALFCMWILGRRNFRRIG